MSLNTNTNQDEGIQEVKLEIDPVTKVPKFLLTITRQRYFEIIDRNLKIVNSQLDNLMNKFKLN
jgi:hypothetical protein